MKLFVLGHEDTVLGFSLIGVEGFATGDAASALAKLQEVVASGEVGLILITPGLAALLVEQLREIELSPHLPLVLQVPAPGEVLNRPPIKETIRKALGVKL